MPATSDAAFDRLATDLRAVVRGEVRFDRGSRALYATDASNYRQPPIGVVVPLDTDDVAGALEVCRTHAAPVFARGGGTSLAGQCCNAAVCFDLSKYMNRVLEVDASSRLARVQPGTILDTLRRHAAGHGLTFGPDPATHTHCTLGGMIGNNSCGVHSVMAQFRGPGPRTSDNVASLDVLTYDGVRLRVGRTSPDEQRARAAEPGRVGEIYRGLSALVSRHADEIRSGVPDLARRVSGYNLRALLPENGFDVAQALVGSESTCVIVLEATLHLVADPPARSLLVLGYPSVFDAADHVPLVMSHRPIGCEGMDDRLVKDIHAIGYETGTLAVLPDGAGWLLVEFGGETSQDADDQARALMQRLRADGAPPSMKLFDDEAEEKRVWKTREAGLGATAHVDRDRPTWEGWEDAAVPPERLGEYLRAFRRLLDRNGLHGDLYGHFGQGCVHTRIDFDLETAEGIRNYRSFVEQAADLVVGLGGSLSGEHGDGQSRGELLPRMYGPAVMAAFEEFKSLWDPGWRMNPGKVLKPYRLDQNLRLGTTYAPPAVRTRFQFPNESGGFPKATLRCVGVGECRRLDGGTMCPSFRVTREEQHSTRGRARLLFEMLEGDPLTGGWQDEHVKEALDLCLACKGCKGDCPVQVDMATYKAEFLSHYFERHLRPRQAFAFGLIHYWARLASLAPGLVNAITHTPGLRTLAKAAAGMAQARDVPAFAPTTFTASRAHRTPAPSPDAPRVLLWPDTFSEHFHPATAAAAARVLERAGFRVDLPRAPVCCGRPLYDYGMLDTARRWLEHVLETLADEIRDGVAIVGLEPSCVAVFRDEARELLPDREEAKRLAAQTFTLAEFLERERVPCPTLRRRVVLHGHCHQKAVMKMDAEQRVLAAMGLDVELLDSGCCGMAGSFGFESNHFGVSMRVGELALLPAVRRAPGDALIVADGFSCRTQIEQATGRRALHLAEVIDMAARFGPDGPPGLYPERAVPTDGAARIPASRVLAVGLVAAGVAAACYLRRHVERLEGGVTLPRQGPALEPARRRDAGPRHQHGQRGRRPRR
jgi:FAD/FMN-containing dehydrogenase/Fe-S oxidoreductase